MKQLIIERKLSPGSIYDIASQYGDRVIKFARGAQYAVVMAAYYGGDGHKTFRSERAAAKYSLDLSRANITHDIVDAVGNSYIAMHDYDGVRLVYRSYSRG